MRRYSHKIVGFVEMVLLHFATFAVTDPVFEVRKMCSDKITHFLGNKLAHRCFTTYRQHFLNSAKKMLFLQSAWHETRLVECISAHGLIRSMFDCSLYSAAACFLP